MSESNTVKSLREKLRSEIDSEGTYKPLRSDEIEQLLVAAAESDPTVPDTLAELRLDLLGTVGCQRDPVKAGHPFQKHELEAVLDAVREGK